MQLLQSLKAVSLKEVFIERFEELILSGQVSAGQKLPSERALALQLGVSRPVVHEGLVELAARGLVTQRPRVGTIVNDYRRHGSLALLSSLINYREGDLDPFLLEALLDLRRLFETETARLAAINRSDDDVKDLYEIVSRESAADRRRCSVLVDVDFEFHHAIALASGNPIYAMLIKSFEPAHKNLSERFFANPSVASGVLYCHARLVAAIDSHNEVLAAQLMATLLDDGVATLTGERGESSTE